MQSKLNTRALILVILILVVTFCLVAGFLAAVGWGIGFLITLGTSSIGFGQAFIAGCVIAAAATFVLIEMVRSMLRKMDSEREMYYQADDEEDEEEEDEFPDEDPVVVLPKDLIKRLHGRPGSRKNRK